MATVGALPFFIPKTVNGVPSHPLIVHAVVVLIPLAVIGTIGIALWPAMRRYFALTVLAVGVVGGLAVPAAVLSGENFRDRLGAAQIVRVHTAFAHKLLWWTLAFVIVLIVMVVLDLARRLGPLTATVAPDAPGDGFNSASGGGGVATVTRVQAPALVAMTTRFERSVGRLIPSALREQVQFLKRAQPILSVVSVVLAVIVGYYCFKTGDSGAKAVWEGR
ncbi:MAG TPA: DUF2231 domain-containing protein [Frankiaceae bacterium]|jgi:hypothetical protein|nr:DUF2231 domain-containing protein [Frankiaceae bacterium]